MSRKQIEEMAKLVCNACEMGCGFEGECCLDHDYKKCGNAVETALAIFNAGYRKQSEGEWGFDGMSWTCSECGEYAPIDKRRQTVKSKFCPNCGAKMKGV